MPLQLQWVEAQLSSGAGLGMGTRQQTGEGVMAKRMPGRGRHNYYETQRVPR